MKRKYSLKKHKDFSYVYRRGKSFSAPCAVLIVARGVPGKVQIGLSISKKMGNAVVRNRCKRRLRAIIQPWLPTLRRNVKIIIIGRVAMLDMDHQTLSRCVYKLFQRGDLFVVKKNATEKNIVKNAAGTHTRDKNTDSLKKGKAGTA